MAADTAKMIVWSRSWWYVFDGEEKARAYTFPDGRDGTEEDAREVILGKWHPKPTIARIWPFNAGTDVVDLEPLTRHHHEEAI